MGKQWSTVLACALVLLGGTARGADVLIEGRKLLLEDDPEQRARRRLKVVGRDTAITLGGGPGSPDDPTARGGSLRVRSIASGFDDTYELPVQRWRTLGPRGAVAGYRLTHAGPIEVALVRQGKRIKIVAEGADLGHDLETNPGSIDVVLTIGALRHCMTFGPDGRYVPGRKHVVKNVPRPAACPPDPGRGLR